MPEEPFEEFCRRLYPQVVSSMLFITGDRQEALDLAQETFARAFERWPSVRTLDRPDYWVHKVATRLAISSLRRRGRRPKPAVATEVVENALPDDDVRQAVLALAPAQRSVIVLRFFLDWSVEDTAHALRKRPGTVKALTSQALDRLRLSVIPPDGEVDHDAR